MATRTEEWVASAQDERVRSWRRASVESRDRWISEHSAEIDVYVGSFGGVASSSIAWFLHYSGIRTNPPDDEAMVKHVNSPDHPLLEPFSIDQFVYVVGDPRVAIASLFRRGIFQFHAPKLTDGFYRPSSDVTLASFASEGRDLLGIQQHTDSWMRPSGRKVSVVNDATDASHVQLFLDQLSFGLRWPERQRNRSRSTTLDSLPRRALEQLDSTYGALTEKLAGMPACTTLPQRTSEVGTLDE